MDNFQIYNANDKPPAILFQTLIHSAKCGMNFGKIPYLGKFLLSLGKSQMGTFTLALG